MIESNLLKLNLYILAICSVVMLAMFGSLGLSIQSCNIELWLDATRPILGQSPIATVKIVWNILLFLMLIPIYNAFKIGGNGKALLLTWSIVGLLLLIVIRNIDLSGDC